MPEVREYFPEVETMQLHELHAEQQRIKESCAGDFKALDDDSLAKLFAISRALRKKAAAPGTGGGRKAAAKKEKNTLDALA